MKFFRESFAELTQNFCGRKTKLAWVLRSEEVGIYNRKSEKGTKRFWQKIRFKKKREKTRFLARKNAWFKKKRKRKQALNHAIDNGKKQVLRSYFQSFVSSHLSISHILLKSTEIQEPPFKIIEPIDHHRW